MNSSKELTVSTVKGWIISLSHSQGFYGRLYRSLDENNYWRSFLSELKKSNVRTPLDMVLYVEC